MKLSEVLNDALNQQIIHELTNSSKYMQIASFFEDLQLSNLANYFKKQSDDEKQHANKFMNHINERIGGKVTLQETPFFNLGLIDIYSVGAIYVEAEENTTASIESLYDLALNEKSYMDLGFLSDMLSEQVLEENEASRFTMNLSMVKDFVLFNSLFGE